MIPQLDPNYAMQTLTSLHNYVTQKVGENSQVTQNQALKRSAQKSKVPLKANVEWGKGLLYRCIGKVNDKNVTVACLCESSAPTETLSNIWHKANCIGKENMQDIVQQAVEVLVRAGHEQGLGIVLLEKELKENQQKIL